MPKHFVFTPAPNGNILECRFPNSPLYDIFLYTSGGVLSDGKTVAISALQIGSRPTEIKKGCLDLLGQKDCDCKFLQKYLASSGINLDLMEDLVVNYCGHRHLVQSKKEIVTVFNYDFQRKDGSHRGALLRAEDFGSLIFEILQEESLLSKASAEQKDVFKYLQSTIQLGDTFLFTLPGGKICKSNVLIRETKSSPFQVSSEMKKITRN